MIFSNTSVHSILHPQIKYLKSVRYCSILSLNIGDIKLSFVLATRICRLIESWLCKIVKFFDFVVVKPNPCTVLVIHD